MGTEKRQLKAIPPTTVGFGTDREAERGLRRVPEIHHHFIISLTCSIVRMT